MELLKENVFEKLDKKYNNKNEYCRFFEYVYCKNDL